MANDLRVREAASSGPAGVGSYAARHSAALLLYPRPHQVDVGSSTCIRIDGRFFLATAGHNIEDLGSDDQIRVLAAGAGSGRVPLHARNCRRFEGAATVDVAWIELEPAAARSSRLRFLELSQVSPDGAADDSPCFVQGFPSAMAVVGDHAPERIDPSPMGFLTKPIDPSSRGERHQPGVDFAVEYAAHDGGEAELPRAPGLSGGGMWRLTRPGRGAGHEGARLVAITRTWFSGRRELCGTAIEHWLRFVYVDFPDLREHLDPVLDRLPSR